MRLPGVISKGANLTEWSKVLEAYLRSITPRSSSNITIATGPGGTSFRALEPQRPSPPSATQGVQPLQLVVTTDPADTSTPPAPKIRVYASTVAGGASTDLGFAPGDTPAYYLTPRVGVVQAGITLDDSTGEITSRWIEIVSALTADTDTNHYVEIGAVSRTTSGGVTTWTAHNSRYGPINAQICRNWFAAESPYYGVTWG